MRIALLCIVGLSACRCDPQPAPQASHVPGFEGLLAATVRDDVPAISQYSDNLIGPDEDDDGGASMSIGAGLGFLAMADAADERALALSAIATGCGECHTARLVPAPRRGDFVHHDGAAWLAYAAVWNQPMAPQQIGLPQVQQALAEASEPDDPLTVGLIACQSCHAASAAGAPL